MEAALPPLGALVLGVFGLISTRAAVWLAFGLGLAVLAVQGVVFARVERLGRFGTLAVVPRMSASASARGPKVWLLTDAPSAGAGGACVPGSRRRAR